MNKIRSLPLIIAAVALSAVPADPQLAFLKADRVYVSDASGGSVQQIDSDSRAKSLLRADRSNRRLAYLVGPRGTELARIVVIDLSGKRISEVAVRPPTDPPTEGMRSVEGLEWTGDGKARVWGSVNPSKCEMFDLDVISGKESNWQLGSCGSFVASPDGKHIAELGPAIQFTPDEDFFESLQIDNKEDVYPATEDAPRITVAAGPLWSPDGQRVAIIEKGRLTGEAAVTVVDLNGTFTRTPVPRSVLDHPSLDWVGSMVVVGLPGVDQLQIDPVGRQVGSITAEVSDELKRRFARKEAAEVRRKQIDALVKKLGGSEGVELKEASAK